jgi:hypothetical protein
MLPGISSVACLHVVSVVSVDCIQLCMCVHSGFRTLIVYLPGCVCHTTAAVPRVQPRTYRGPAGWHQAAGVQGESTGPPVSARGQMQLVCVERAYRLAGTILPGWQNRMICFLKAFQCVCLALFVFTSGSTYISRDAPCFPAGRGWVREDPVSKARHDGHRSVGDCACISSAS